LLELKDINKLLVLSPKSAKQIHPAKKWRHGDGGGYAQACPRKYGLAFVCAAVALNEPWNCGAWFLSLEQMSRVTD
jgi:hypothetical protein